MLWEDSDREAPASGHGARQEAMLTDMLSLVWVDLGGLRRSRVVPIYSDTLSQQVSRLRGEGLGLAKCCFVLPPPGDAPAPNSGLDVTGEVRLLLPPPTSREPISPSRPLPSPRLRAVVADVMGTDGRPWALDSRNVLRRTVASAAASHGLSFRCGFELEFTLFKGDQPLGGDQAYARTGKYLCAHEIMLEVTEALLGLGVRPEQVHAESAPGQFEVVLPHGEVLEAVDTLVLARETLDAVAARHNLRVCYLPKPFAASAGNGLHVHFSALDASGQPVFEQPPPEGQVLPQLAARLVAGVLHHLPALVCFTAGSPSSFRRLAPSSWCGAYTGWGVLNKEAPLRLCRVSDASPISNVEYKNMDCTCNPYLALSAILAAALDGVTSARDLPAPLPADPALLSEKQREHCSAHRLPTSWAEAELTLRSPSHEALVSALGPELVRAAVAVRAVEHEGGAGSASARFLY